MNNTNFNYPFLIAALFLILQSNYALSQDCPNMDIELNSQEEIDNFSTLYPNCTELKRDLCVGKCKATNLPYPVITSLAGLSQIVKINGSLEIKSTTGLTNLNGLHNIEEIGHNLIIRVIEDLVTLEGLDKLKVIGCDLELEYLPVTTLQGLENLDTLKGTLNIKVNNNLVSLDGIDGLKVEHEIRIAYNEVLENINALSGVTSITENVSIAECPSLVNLQGLHNLKSVGNILGIGGNDMLEDLSGLESLKDVGDRFRITFNPNLQNLNGLDNFKSASILEIAQNESLNSLEGMLQLDSLSYLALSSNNFEHILGLEQLSYIHTISMSEDNLLDLNGFGTGNILGNLFLNDNPSLENLDGLQQFDSIGVLRIKGCNALKDLSGLKETVSFDDFYLKENTSLENLEGLSEIISVDVFQLRDNNNLVNLNGLNVRSMDNLQIYNDSLLSSLEGLEMIDHVNTISLEKLPSLTLLQPPVSKSLESLHIRECNALTNLQGLNSIDTIDYLSIQLNQSLVSLDGLESLRMIYGCQIVLNPVLENIGGLQNIDPEKILEFGISENPKLMMCNYSNICEFLLNHPYGWVNLNGPGCNWPDDFYCEGKIEGTVVYDLNCNGELDPNDIPLEGIEINFPNNNLTRYTSSVGKFFRIPQEGEEVHIQFNDTPEWQLKSGADSYQFVYDPAQTDCCSYNFLLDYVDKRHDAEIDVFLPNLRCNSDVELKVHYTLSGGLEAEGKVRLNIDELSQFVSAEPAPSTINGQWIEWDFPKTLPFEKKTITIKLMMPDEMAIDEELHFTADIALKELQSNIVDTEVVSGIVLCAFDPNDKQVFPSSENGYTNFNDSILLYTVRFQNVGNAEAIDISIRDTISEHLDIESFRLVSTSHREFLSISRYEPNVMSFDFDEIYLIDSLSDPEMSQGYVQYSIALKKNLAPGTQIDNTAHIYFDNNPPIVTNTTRNEFYFDQDQDGFLSILDCNDTNGDVNPQSAEIIYNGLDDDCNALTLDDDLDEDGYGIAEDCDDDNENINPQIEEIAYNGIDDDCNALTLDDDLDKDGFGIAEDCDDDNENINPQIEEITYNGIDDDCDELTLDDDLDQDGYGIDLDCDDNNENISPQIEEIVYNGLDDDCDELTLDDDLDEDGFGIEEDCDDLNHEINPDTPEIPDNDIDENCDGIIEYTTSTKEVKRNQITIYPNPTNMELNIVSTDLDLREVRIYDTEGRMVLSQKIDGPIDVDHLMPGVYILKCVESNSNIYNRKVVIME